MVSYVVHKEIRIKAQPEVVWDALTNPEKTKKYFFNCAVNSKWKQGSKITFSGKIFLFFPIELTGEILEIEPGSLLKYKLKNASDKNGSFSVVTDRLTYDQGLTTLDIHDDVGTGEGAKERYLKSLKGWEKVLKSLKKMIEEEH